MYMTFEIVLHKYRADLQAEVCFKNTRIAEKRTQFIIHLDVNIFKIMCAKIQGLKS